MTLLEKMSRAMEPDLWRQIDQNNAGSKVYRTAALNRAAEGVRAIREPSESMMRRGELLHRGNLVYGDIERTWVEMIDTMLNEQA